MRQMILDIRPDAPPTLDNFLPGGNVEALHALNQVAAGGDTERIYYLWGPAGVGKSHLLRALVSRRLEAGRPAVYLPSGMPLPEELSGVLALDDVACLSEADQIQLFNLINAAREGHGIVVVAGAHAPAHLGLRLDLTTRLSWGMVYGLAPLSEQDKLEALKARATARGMRLPEEVGQYMLVHCRRDLPHLLATVDALDTYSLSLRRPVTVPLLRHLLAAAPR